MAIFNSYFDITRPGHMKFKKSIDSTENGAPKSSHFPKPSDDPASRIPVDGNTYDLVFGAQYKKAGDNVG